MRFYYNLSQYIYIHTRPVMTGNDHTHTHTRHIYIYLRRSRLITALV